MAPDIWFAFLKTGETADLRGICDHNVKDIFGLTRLFSALVHIAENPLRASSAYAYDVERLALQWRKFCRPNRRQGKGPLEKRSLAEEAIPETGKSLLSVAASQGHPQAALALAYDLFRAGEHEAGRRCLRSILEGPHSPYIKALVRRALAIDAERRLRDPALALSYTEAALDAPSSGVGASTLPPRLREDLTRRKDRLRRRVEK